jgi:hypothetical protein
VAGRDVAGSARNEPHGRLGRHDSDGFDGGEDESLGFRVGCRCRELTCVCGLGIMVRGGGCVEPAGEGRV